MTAFVQCRTSGSALFTAGARPTPRWLSDSRSFVARDIRLAVRQRVPPEEHPSPGGTVEDILLWFDKRRYGSFGQLAVTPNPTVACETLPLPLGLRGVNWCE